MLISTWILYFPGSSLCSYSFIRATKGQGPKANSGIKEIIPWEKGSFSFTQILKSQMWRKMLVIRIKKKSSHWSVPRVSRGLCSLAVSNSMSVVFWRTAVLRWLLFLSPSFLVLRQHQNKRGLQKLILLKIQWRHTETKNTWKVNKNCCLLYH